VASCGSGAVCREGEESVSFVASEGTATVLEAATRQDGRFALEIWWPVLRRNLAKTGVELSTDPTACFTASRLLLTGPVKDVTERCGTVGRDEADAFLACEIAQCDGERRAGGQWTRRP